MTQEESLADDIADDQLTPAQIRTQEAQVGKWIKHPRQWIPFDKVTPDEGMRLGQSRELDNQRVYDYAVEVRANPKRAPLEDVLAVLTTQRGMRLVRDFAYPWFVPSNLFQVLFVRDVAYTPPLSSQMASTFSSAGSTYVMRTS